MPANILGWFNVKDYGAIGNGIANDTTHVQAAIDAVTPPGGIVYFPQGSFVTNGVSTTNDAAVPIYFVGCGVGITTLFANTAFDDAVIRLQRPGGFEGMTVDAGGLAKYAIAVTSATSIPLANVLLRDVRCTASHKTGGPCLYFSAIAPSFLPLFGEVTFDRVIVDRSASLDGGAVIANVGTLFVQNFTTTDCIGPGPNFFIIERLFMNGAYAANNPQDSGLTIDQFVKEAHVSNLAVDVSCSDGVVMAAQKLYLTNSNIQATTFLNQPDSANPQYVETCNCDFAAIAIQGPPPLGFKIVGGNVAAPAGNAAAINFTQSVGSILSNVVIVGATFDNAAIPAWIRSVHPITLTNSVISRNIVKGTSSVTNIRSSVGVDLNAADFALSTGAPGLDNTIALQRAINACLNLGGGVVRVPHSSGADYDLAGYVSIPPGSPAITLRGEAPGTVFVQTKANEPVIAIGDRTTLAGTTGVRVENLSVKSTAASGSTGPGIQITNSTKVYLDRVEFANLD
ncbi:MAG: hypothetical protein JO192_08525, partial [Candidatus Eremiobacteraeota bacterium]|nr:hypothetical protein [Candidatus Eremiobacteraeota bacterium]